MPYTSWMHKFGIVAALLLAAGCSKSSGDAPTAGKAAELKPFAITSLGLVGDAPADAADSELMGDRMIKASGLTASVKVAKTPQTVAEAKSDADMYSPKNLKAEELADGYVITFDNKGAMGKNFWVVSQRTIAGKAIACGTTAQDAAQQTAAAAFCKSLKAAK